MLQSSNFLGNDLAHLRVIPLKKNDVGEGQNAWNKDHFPSTQNEMELIPQC